MFGWICTSKGTLCSIKTDLRLNRLSLPIQQNRFLFRHRKSFHKPRCSAWKLDRHRHQFHRQRCVEDKIKKYDRRSVERRKSTSGVYKVKIIFTVDSVAGKGQVTMGVGFKQQSAVHRNRNKPDKHHVASAVGQRSRISYPFPAVPMGVRHARSNDYGVRKEA